MIINIISDYLRELNLLFINMSPYILLGLLMSAVLNVIVSQDFIARHMGGHSWKQIIKASLFGVPLPLCSCGVLPTAVYLKKSGASLPALQSFLISTPQTGVDSIIATYGLLGPFFAFFRPVSALFMGISSGFISRLLSKEENQNHTKKTGSSFFRKDIKSFKERGRLFLRYFTKEGVDDLSSNFIIGILAAALITFILPENFFTDTAFAEGPLAMLFMLILGMPLYICSTSSIPVALALMAKGISPGAAYVFLISGPVTNITSLSVLLKNLGKKQTLLYIFSIIGGSLFFGLMIDFLNRFFPIKELIPIKAFMEHGHSLPWHYYLLSAFFLILLLFSVFRLSKNFIKARIQTRKKIEGFEYCVLIDGIDCSHCANIIDKVLIEIPGIEGVKVDLEEKKAGINGKFSKEEIQAVLEKNGYSLKSLF